LEAKGKELHQSYLDNEPFPHAVIDNFLPAQIAENLLAVYPESDSDVWLDWTKRDTVHQPLKQGIGDASRLAFASPYLNHILAMFQTYPFINFLEKLTGIEKLLPDPQFAGGGLHQILPGGHLNVHTDFNFHAKMNIYRRINALLYLNRDWRPDFGGDLELWDVEGETCLRTVAPLFNRLVVFNTDKNSFHGHPKPLTSPPGVTRKSLAFYFYTAQPEGGKHYDPRTDWVEGQGQHG
jgi:hypothetical protein